MKIIRFKLHSNELYKAYTKIARSIYNEDMIVLGGYLFGKNVNVKIAPEKRYNKDIVTVMNVAYLIPKKKSKIITHNCVI